MQEILILSISVSLLINFFLIRRGSQLISEIESIQNTLLDERNYVRNNLNDMLREMRTLDSRGAFESDDEVGVIFKELKEVIQKYEENLF